MTPLVTGGAGFIGSAFVRDVLADRPETDVVTSTFPAQVSACTDS